jgi:quercetin dioxygenase-like cupin family protein
MDEVRIEQWTLSGPAPAPLDGVGASIRQVHIPAGTVGTKHSHTHEQFFRVLSGAGQLACAAGSVPLRPGTVVHFAPGAWHQAEFSEDTVLLEVNLAEMTG